MMPEVKRAAVERQEIDAKDRLWLGRPPGRVMTAVTPDHADDAVLELLGKNIAVDVEPVLLDRRFLGRVKKDAEVAHGLVAGDLTEEDDRRGEVHGLRRRLL